MKKRILCIALSLFMVLSLVPAVTLAQDAETNLSYDDCAAGEAIVCMKKASPRARNAASGLLANATVLMDLSDDTAAARARSAPTDSSGQVLALVKDENLSTEALIAELNTYDQVIFAEPNYNICPITDDLDTAAADETLKTASASAAFNDASTVDDMTAYQWAYNNTGDYFSSLEGFDINYEAWNTSTGTSDDSDIVVAVLDTGVDDTHPDLKDKMWTRGDLDLPGGEHGISFAASEEGDGDTSDPDGHGTQCAGIIGAAWNDFGVSGTSQNAKIMAVRYAETLSAVLSCYDYMADAIDLGVNLKAVNCSFGVTGSPKSLDLAVKALGERGAISVYAAGNSNADNDRTATLSSTFVGNPYAIVVDAANAYGKLASYTDYGERTTDVVAPGTRILSTCPTDQSLYYPEFSNDNLFYEGFEGEDSLKFYTSADPKTGEAVGEVTSEKVYSGKNSIQFQATAEGAVVYSEPINLKAQPGFDASQTYYLSLSAAAAGDNGFGQALVMVRLTDGSFAPLGNGASLARGRDGGFSSITSAANQTLPENTDFENFQLRLELTGLELLLSNGYIQYNAIDTRLYIDGLGIGTETLPYAYSDGTSMATPMVTGTVAVLAEGIPDDSAAMRAARIIGSVTKYVDFTDKCVSDGLLNIDSADNPAPVINAAEITTDTVTIDGYFFGDDPTVTIGDKPASIQSKETTGDGGQKLVVSRPEGTSGMTRISVTSTEKGEGHQSFDFGEVSGTDYFENTLPLPEDPSFFDIDAYQLVGCGDYLYCIPKVYVIPNATDSLWRFNINTKTWDQLALPEGVEIVYATAAVWQDKLLIYNYNSGIDTTDPESPTAIGTIMTYDGSTWRQTPGWSAEEFPESATLVANDGQLLAVGGNYGNTICAVDLENHSLTPAGSIARSVSGALVSAGHGQLIVTGGLTFNNQNGMLGGGERLTLGSDGLYTSESLDMTGINADNLSGFASAATKDGFMLVGPETEDDVTDTYTLAANGSLIPYSKRADNAALSSPTATAYKGQFYVLARTYTTDSNYIFKSTAVETEDNVVPDNPDTPGTPATPNTQENQDSSSTQTDNVSTGIQDTLPTACIAAALLLAAGIVIFIRRKQKLN